MAESERCVVEVEERREGVDLAGDAPRIHFTAAALEATREIIREAGLADGGGLRLSARTGAGCSAPLQLGIFLEQAPRADDTVLRSGEVRLLLDPESAWVLDGLQVDYLTDSPMGEGFAFRHPKGVGGRTC
ncbi:MAG: iron-sulfur cluster assembly accessory protein [Gemmatimonadetes bacterium]|nr:iron-sulfur cluster assembly accessory protein [Gemmatimonadota bacterium]NIR80878.1 iron-sulfur cluster assembly accessory protein [Gemmatimonadota bacterium]NIT89697.1 iron-sulfur cluster assembly accessory protein [Gemmatimonadota bacterium]NIU33481.1 iron-sulfur cluster assembly accessory protein [Gemmatimonadota bacterium]NIU37763.1 iron-sulfur cluster assembly accessory protein [Gemmatimonadota bacterium]